MKTTIDGATLLLIPHCSPTNVFVNIYLECSINISFEQDLFQVSVSYVFFLTQQGASDITS
jgi:hypothetical protein